MICEFYLVISSERSTCCRTWWFMEFPTEQEIRPVHSLLYRSHLSRRRRTWSRLISKGTEGHTKRSSIQKPRSRSQNRAFFKTTAGRPWTLDARINSMSDLFSSIRASSLLFLLIRTCRLCIWNVYNRFYANRENSFLEKFVCSSSRIYS